MGADLHILHKIEKNYFVNCVGLTSLLYMHYIPFIWRKAITIIMSLNADS